jgi:hypothetical protein
MKAEALEEADCRRKYQGSDKGKRQGTIVDLPFMLIVRAKKTRQEQDRYPRSHDGQSAQGCAERRTLTLNADSNETEKRREIEEYERGSAFVGEIVLEGVLIQDMPPQRHQLEYAIALHMSSIRYLLYAIGLLRIRGPVLKQKERSPGVAGRGERASVCAQGLRGGVTRPGRQKQRGIDPLCS